ncbi:alpha/beta fold hydrolase [Poseidonocella sp. HB161398]|uniref:alpha/beta fold hydrolase n=1 Tax=Poseidonocella sp. HB161398 TaxID=2320855 RepID=UPI0014876018|nr:alpha/beta fold hydrolase [Poseidonocella sp. HB161398]
MTWQHSSRAGRFTLSEAGGSGPPLVLVHGWGGSAAQWQALLPGLVAQWRVFAADLPGGPVHPLEGSVSMATLGQGVAALLDAAGIGEAVLLGHSMGGPVVVEAALAAHGHVRGLLGLDTLADRTFYGGSDALEIARRRAAFGADIAGATRRMVAAIANPATGAARCNAIAAEVLRARPADLLELRDALFAWDIAARLPGLSCPLRLLNSAAVEVAHAQDPLPCLGKVPRRIYGAGHFPQIEAPALLLPILLAELAELAETDAETPFQYTATDLPHIP